MYFSLFVSKLCYVAVISTATADTATAAAT